MVEIKGRSLEDWKKTVRFQDITQLLTEWEIISLEAAKIYRGIFTGKMVKPDLESKYSRLEDFNPGERVLVINEDDLLKFYAFSELYRAALDNWLEEYSKKYKKK